MRNAIVLVKNKLSHSRHSKISIKRGKSTYSVLLRIDLIEEIRFAIFSLVERGILRELLGYLLDSERVNSKKTQHINTRPLSLERGSLLRPMNIKTKKTNPRESLLLDMHESAT